MPFLRSRLLRIGVSALDSFDTPRRNPKHPRRRERVNGPSLPPGDFVSGAMVVTVMNSAQRHRELVAHLQSHRPRLSESEVMSVSGASPADQTGLRCYEPEVGLVAESPGFAERKYTFVDLAGSVVVNVC
jgi:hypothetical protein